MDQLTITHTRTIANAPRCEGYNLRTGALCNGHSTYKVDAGGQLEYYACIAHVGALVSTAFMHLEAFRERIADGLA